MIDAESIAALLVAFRFRGRAEADVQEAIAQILGDAFADQVQREVELGKENRIDFIVGKVGIEVKVGGSSIDVYRQVQRYASRPEIDSVIIASTKAAVLSDLPSTVGGKPLYLLHLRSYL